jgi:hypothetical protein
MFTTIRESLGTAFGPFSRTGSWFAMSCLLASIEGEGTGGAVLAVWAESLVQLESTSASEMIAALRGILYLIIRI